MLAGFLSEATVLDEGEAGNGLLLLFDMVNSATLNFLYFCIACLLTGVFSSCADGRKGETQVPNVIVIYADDLGYGDLSSYGGEIPTPYIDDIGKNGIRFTNFYVAGSVCTPSRFGLLTGAYPVRSRDTLTRALMPFENAQLAPEEKTIAWYLKKAGYRTGLIGKWHLGEGDGALPTDHGFDEFTGFTLGCIDFFTHKYGPVQENWYVQGQPAKENGYSTDLITRHAKVFLEQQARADKPFFLYLPYNAPHFGKTDPEEFPENTLLLKQAPFREFTVANTLQAPAEYLERFKHIEDPYRRYYAAMVSSLDDNVGEVIAKVRALGLEENTMIWFISDNGGYSESYYGHASNGKLRGEKGSLWEGGIRVPGLVQWKGKIEPGQVAGSPVSNIDLLPSLATLLGLERDEHSIFWDGININELLLNGKEITRDLFWAFRGETAYLSGEWKLKGDSAVYHLGTDVSEQTNVAGNHPQVLASLISKRDSLLRTIKRD